jgi:putative PIN family toxin of toxin-antitoxin system
MYLLEVSVPFMIPPNRINKPYQIVIDTNVLVAGLRSNRGASYKLLTILNDARWQVNISTTLIFEYEEILKRSSLELGLSFPDIDAIIRGICSISHQRQIFYVWRPTSTDPDDDFLIDLAVKAQAEFLVTYNQRNLQPAERFGIKVVSPKQFLQFIGEIP